MNAATTCAAARRPRRGAALMDALAANASLRSLTVLANGSASLGAAAYPALRRALPQNRTLETLVLETNGDEGCTGFESDGDIPQSIFASLVCNQHHRSSSSAGSACCASLAQSAERSAVAQARVAAHRHPGRRRGPGAQPAARGAPARAAHGRKTWPP